VNPFSLNSFNSEKGRTNSDFYSDSDHSYHAVLNGQGSFKTGYISCSNTGDGNFWRTKEQGWEKEEDDDLHDPNKDIR